MTEVWVRADDAARGSLPARCARSGQRCITRYAVKVDGMDDGIVLPLLPWRRRWASMLQQARRVTVVLLVIGFVVAVVARGGLPDRLAGALLMGAAMTHVLAFVAIRMTVVDVRTDHTGEWVLLSRVHPGFAEATAASTTRPASTPVLAGPTPGTAASSKEPR